MRTYLFPLSWRLTVNQQLPITHDAPHRTIIKLRHPSRLHTHDLTENTFRIYVKHYIDCIQEPQRCGYDSNAIVIGSTTQLPSTPTKQSRFDETPRASTRHDTHITPRQRIPLPIFGTRGAENISLELPPSSQAPTTTRRGVTLSYLRRVPELSLLAARVTEAVARRRTRAERKRLQEAGLLQKGRPLPPSDNADKQGPRMKRLFQFAIIQLLKEGNITLWDGPVRRCPDTSIMNISRLWKSNTSTSTDGGDSTVFGSTYSSIPSFLEDDNDEGTLSDPDANEEAYISLTPEYFSEYVEDAIKVLVDYYQRIGKPYAGATREGILQVLRKDDQWRRVGTWTIDDALEYLKVEGRVWNMGKGRWDLTEWIHMMQCQRWPFVFLVSHLNLASVMHAQSIPIRLYLLSTLFHIFSCWCTHGRIFCIVHLPLSNHTSFHRILMTSICHGHHQGSSTAPTLFF